MTEILTSVDRADMLGAIDSLPEQLERSAAAALASDVRSKIQERIGTTPPRALVVCGMGGSGVGADLLGACAELQMPVIPVKGYDLPDWVSPDDAVICVSYSGATAETLSCVRQTIERSRLVAAVTSGGELGAIAASDGAPILEVTPGMQPRAAVGVLFGSLIVAAEGVGAVRDAASVARDAAAGAQRVVSEHAVRDGSPGHELASRLAGTVPLIYAAGRLTAVAGRWKAQINENSKWPAFTHAYPELDHNELVGWQGATQTGAKWSVVELCATDDREENRMRMDVTSGLLASDASHIERIVARETTRAGSAFELIAIGDYVSAFLGIDRGIDPSPVERIQSLKASLNGR